MITRRKIERLTGLLKTLEGSTQNIEATSVVSADGFMIAPALPYNTKNDKVAVMSATMRLLGEAAARELGRGKLSEVHVKGRKGALVLTVSGNAVLTTLMKNDETDPVFVNMRKTAEEVAELV